MSMAAVFGLVGAFLFWPVGLILSIIGIGHTKPGRKRGRGVAVAGLVLSALFGVIAIAVIAAVAGGASSSTTEAAAPVASQASSAQSIEPAPEDAAPVEEAPVEEAAEEADEPADAPAATASQKQALRAAEQYLGTMPFSYAGLIDQLSSEYGSQFSVEDATYAADNVGADWNDQAAKAAEQYLETMAFSRANLIDQLTSENGSQFTQEQAEYGADQAGL